MRVVTRCLSVAAAAGTRRDTPPAGSEDGSDEYLRSCWRYEADAVSAVTGAAVSEVVPRLNGLLAAFEGKVRRLPLLSASNKHGLLSNRLARITSGFGSTVGRRTLFTTSRHR